MCVGTHILMLHQKLKFAKSVTYQLFCITYSILMTSIYVYYSKPPIHLTSSYTLTVKKRIIKCLYCPTSVLALQTLNLTMEFQFYSIRTPTNKVILFVFMKQIPDTNVIRESIINVNEFIFFLSFFNFSDKAGNFTFLYRKIFYLVFLLRFMKDLVIAKFNYG